jgi:general secretion pathway protein G
MVELLVVVLIIAILIALLVPAIVAAVRRANDARVVAEIEQMGTGLANFQQSQQFGDLPPSRIILLEGGGYSALAGSTAPLSSVTWYTTTGAQPLISPGDITVGELAQRSYQYLQKFFPRATFLGSGIPNYASFVGGPANVANCFDFNGNGICDNAPIYLEGHECLVFFLGGLPSRTIDATSGQPVFGTTGWYKNQLNPFVALGNPAVPNSNNRQPPIFTNFRPEQLMDEDGDLMPGYADPLGQQADMRPYAYFRAYGGNGNYDPNDCNFHVDTDQTNSYIMMRAFQVQFTTLLGPPQVCFSFAPNPYTASDPVFYGNNGFLTTTPPSYHQPETYQVISAGRDHLYGIGGKYTPNSAEEPLPLPDVPTAGVPGNVQNQNLSQGDRLREQDNITNFAKGTLQ